MKYPKEYLDEIKTRLKVSTVVSKSVNLKKRGKEFVGLSPFKTEKTPSFTVNDDKGFYHCFSTAEHGNIFDFIMKTQNLKFGEAVKYLANLAGMQPYTFSKKDEEREKKWNEYSEIFKMYVEFYHNELLKNRDLNFAREYLKKRKLSKEDVLNFKIGFVPFNANFYEKIKSKFNEKNIIDIDGDEYEVNGRKWFTSGANDPRCKVYIFMGKSDSKNPDRHKQQSMIVVPADSEGIKVLRHLPVFGYDDAPHGHAEVVFKNVRVPAKNMLLGEGRGFEIAQGRLGPGRIHHCMRLIGVAEVALEKMCKRTKERVAFGKPVSEQTVTQERIAESRIMIDQCRLLTLNAAHKMDVHGNKEARKEIAMIKVAAPNMACKIIDWAIQAHGGGGVTEDFGLAKMYAQSRTLRLADGPDEVHHMVVGRAELQKYDLW